MKFKAKDDFCIDLVDGDDFLLEENGFFVKKDSIWYIEDEDIEDFNNGGEVSLYELNSSRYFLHVDEEYVNSLFELV